MRINLIYTFIVLFALSSHSSDAARIGKGWTKEEAQSKLGMRVRCVKESTTALYKWGPIRKNGRPTYKKPLGAGVKPGATGTVKDVVNQPGHEIEIVVEWDPDEKNEVWESYLYKRDYDFVVEIRGSDGAMSK